MGTARHPLQAGNSSSKVAVIGTAFSLLSTCWCVSAARASGFGALIAEAHRQQDEWRGRQAPAQAYARNDAPDFTPAPAAPVRDPVAEAAAVAEVERQRVAAEILAKRQSEASSANNLGVQLFKDGDFASAIAAFREAVSKNPDDPVMQQNLANAREGLKEQERRKAAAARTNARRAEAAASAGRMGQEIDGLADAFLADGTIRQTNATSADGLGGRRSDPAHQSGPSLEHDAARNGLGFDTPGPINGHLADAPPTPEASGEPGILPKFENTAEVRQLRVYETQAMDAKRAAAAAQLRLEDERAKNPGSGAVIMLQFRAKEAQDHAGHLGNMVAVQKKIIQKMISLTPVDAGEAGNPPQPQPAPLAPTVPSPAPEQP